jgi:hypothetical protein
MTTMTTMATTATMVLRRWDTGNTHSLLWLHCSLIQLGGKDQGLISHVCFIFHNQSKCVCSIRTNHPSYSHYFGLSLLSFPSR